MATYNVCNQRACNLVDIVVIKALPHEPKWTVTGNYVRKVA